MSATTPSERKALLFLAIVALLGAGVRVWRVQRHPARIHSAVSDSTAHDPALQHATSRRSRDRRATSAAGRSRATRPSRDSLVIIDLDRSGADRIESLGVLRRGVARLIVADREQYGPFGSLDELRRVSALSASDIRRLAPHVTFSLLPRPTNVVTSVRPEPAPHSAARAPRRRGREPFQP